MVDPTGARRFWPIAVQAFDVPWIHAHRDQLWAEAVVRELRGDSIRLPESLWPSATVEQEQRREVDSWEDQLRAFALAAALDGDNRRRITTDALYGALSIPLERRDRSSSLRIAEIMRRLGFRRVSVRPVGCEVQRGYVTEYPDLLELSEPDGVGGPGELAPF